MLIEENRWRAMRYSFDGGLIDLAKGAVIPFADLMEELLGLVAEDAVALNCEKEIAGVRTILNRGTSAHHQLKSYELAIAEGANKEDALKSVVDTLINNTATDL
jgi:carboxylate-amine ligase